MSSEQEARWANTSKITVGPLINYIQTRFTVPIDPTLMMLSLTKAVEGASFRNKPESSPVIYIINIQQSIPTTVQHFSPHQGKGV
jgi:hypothetical protein